MNKNNSKKKKNNNNSKTTSTVKEIVYSEPNWVIISREHNS